MCGCDKKGDIRVLVNAPLRMGGISSLMLNIQKNLNREKVNLDYLVFHDTKEPQEDIAFEMGSKKIVVSRDDVKIKPLRGLLRFFTMCKTLRENNIKILHYNDGSAIGILTVIAARLGGVKYVTYHSHNGGDDDDNNNIKRIINPICKKLIPIFADDMWACSSEAAKYTFPKKVVREKRFYFMPNAIDLNKYAFNEKVRNEVRATLKLEGKFVVGHVGRFFHQKNHSFLIDAFKAIHERVPNAVLIMFGSGELQESIKEKVKSLKLDDCVIFYGNCFEMEKMYQAMDIFLMPSHFEGLPVSGVEAQAAGLPVIFSDTITREVGINENVSYLPIDGSAEAWADAAISYMDKPRIRSVEKLRESGFDEKDVVEHFQNYYLNVGKKLKLA
jgi:glycosyltransferase involved in cell wall biosynthesis